MRFGNKQLLISTHIDKLLSITPVQNVNEIKKLREVYDLIEVHARNLKMLDVNTKEYGPVLISIVMSKLPNDIRLVISRSMSLNDKWDVDVLLQILKREVESREMCFMMSNNNFEDKQKHAAKRNVKNNVENFTASSLVTN